MRVKRLADATPYEAPNHTHMAALRLQGFEPDGAKGFWVGLSHILPGGGAGPDASPLEKVYVMLTGHLRVSADGEEADLAPLDSVHITGGVTREVRNTTNAVATMLVIMPYPAAS